MNSYNYKFHLRSLFISKFYIKNTKSFNYLNNMSIVINAPIADYNIINLFLFLLGNSWPCFLLDSSLLYSKSYLFLNKKLLKKLRYVLLNNFTLNKKWTSETNKKKIFRLNNLLPNFIEIDYLSDYTYTFLKMYSEYWKFYLIVLSSTDNKKQNESMLKAFFW